MTKITNEMSIELTSREPDECVIDFKSESKKTPKKSRGEPTPCPICGVIICNRYNLSCHLRRHNNDKPYICDVCNKAFILPAELKRHKVIHSKDSPFKCKVCSKGFKCIESLRLHFDNHGLNEYKCRFCDLVFTKNRIRGSHEKNFHNKSLLKCKYCYKTFSESRYKEQHESEVHIKKIKPDPDGEACETRIIEVNSYGIKVEPLKKSGKQPRQRRPLQRQNNIERSVKRFDRNFKFYACKFCPERFKFRKEQISHYQHFHKEEFDNVFIVCKECGKMLTKKHYASHMQAHAGDCPFECHLCDYKSARKYDLLNHMLVHTKEYRFKCSHCQKPFRSKASALVCEKKHTGIKEVKCNSCDMTFYSVVDLRSHVVAKHKLRKCDLCGFETTVKYSFDKHRELHHKSSLKSKSLMCDKCGTLYATQKNLLKHLSTHHSGNSFISEYKKHVCYYCDYQGSSSSDILNHCVEFHISKVYKCEICLYLTLKINHFITHMKNHIQDSAHEMYICSILEKEEEKMLKSYTLECFICGFSSVHKEIMNEHIEMHNDNFKKFKWYRSNSFYKSLRQSEEEPESGNEDDINENPELLEDKNASMPLNLCKISLDDSSEYENDFKEKYDFERIVIDDWCENGIENESIIIFPDTKEEIMPEKSIKIENVW